MLNESYGIISSVIQPNGLAIASPSKDYSDIWIRDSIYMILPFINKSCTTYETALHRWLDTMIEYEWKIDIHTKQKPQQQHEYIHSKYSKDDVRELSVPWGHAQHDAIGLLLWAIGKGEKSGKKIIRNQKDHQIVQKLVWYLATCQYWMDVDNGMWEEWREIHSSSIGACVAGLLEIKDHVFVPRDLWMRGYATLANMFPAESADRPIDLAQLSLIYPYKIFIGEDARTIVRMVEERLLRARGVARYEGDSYYALNEHEGRHFPLSHYFGKEAEWTFGLPWLALCHIQLGDIKKAMEYVKHTEDVMLDGGVLPELYYAGTDKPNPNTPLGWCSAMYILAKEELGAYQ